MVTSATEQQQQRNNREKKRHGYRSATYVLSKLDNRNFWNSLTLKVNARMAVVINNPPGEMHWTGT